MEKMNGLCCNEETDDVEKRLFEAFNDRIQNLDPDTIEGHNIFKFDLDYLCIRYKHHKVPMNWEFMDKMLRSAQVALKSLNAVLTSLAVTFPRSYSLRYLSHDPALRHYKTRASRLLLSR